MVGTKIKMFRVKHGFTQQEAADLLGISRPTYRLKESGKRSFMFDEVVKLLQAWSELENLNDLLN